MKGNHILQGQILSLEALVGALSGRNDRCVTNQGIMDSGVRNQIGLEFIQIDIEGTIESQRRGDGADNLSNQAIQVLERRPGNIKVAAANIVDGFVVNKEGTVAVLNRGVGREDSIVRLDDGGGNARSGVDGEFELGFLAIVGG